MSENSLYESVTNRLIEDLEKGVRPWIQNWKDKGIPVLRPRRHNGDYYNGVNILLLWKAADQQGFCLPTWMTFKQALELGGAVRKGEKSTKIIYVNKLLKAETDGITGEEAVREIPYLKSYAVFNVDQIDGLPGAYYAKPEPFIKETDAPKKIEALEQFFRATGAIIKHGGGRAYYQKNCDRIQMPPLEAFDTAEGYYATLAHETTHWTGHESRLNRPFGSLTDKETLETYAKEEFIAEIGSAFLCADLGITPEVLPDHAAYISVWLQALRNDKKLIFTAASLASKAADFLKSLQPKVEVESKPTQDVSLSESAKSQSTFSAHEATAVRLKILPALEQAEAGALYTSPEMTIGTHDWRLKIFKNAYQQTVTSYEFKGDSSAFWNDQRNWPSYNGNDTFLGLPKGIAKLYEREKPALIKYGLLPLSALCKQPRLDL